MPMEHGHQAHRPGRAPPAPDVHVARDGGRAPQRGGPRRRRRDSSPGMPAPPPARPPPVPGDGTHRYDVTTLLRCNVSPPQRPSVPLFQRSTVTTVTRRNARHPQRRDVLMPNCRLMAKIVVTHSREGVAARRATGRPRLGDGRHQHLNMGLPLAGSSNGTPACRSGEGPGTPPGHRLS